MDHSKDNWLEKAMYKVFGEYKPSEEPVRQKAPAMQGTLRDYDTALRSPNAAIRDAAAIAVGGMGGKAIDLIPALGTIYDRAGATPAELAHANNAVFRLAFTGVTPALALLGKIVGTLEHPAVNVRLGAYAALQRLAPLAAIEGGRNGSRDRAKLDQSLALIRNGLADVNPLARGAAYQAGNAIAACIPEQPAAEPKPVTVMPTQILPRVTVVSSLKTLAA